MGVTVSLGDAATDLLQSNKIVERVNAVVSASSTEPAHKIVTMVNDAVCDCLGDETCADSDTTVGVRVSSRGRVQKRNRINDDMYVV